MRTLDSIVDAAFPLLRPSIDFCCPGCYPLPPVFPMFPLLDVRLYSNQGQKSDHV